MKEVDVEVEGRRSRARHGGDDERLEQAIAQIRRALQGLTFGQLTVVVHDGVVVQVERTEKFRIPGGPGR